MTPDDPSIEEVEAPSPEADVVGTADAVADADAAVPNADPPQRSDTEEIVAIARNLGSAGVFGLLTIVVPLIGLFFMVTFMSKIQPWIQSLGMKGAVAFAIIMMLMAGLAIMPTQAFSIFVGLLIGKALGLGIGAAVAISGAVGAAILGYAWAVVVAKERVMREVGAHPKARIIHHALVDRGFWESLGIVTLLRFPPNLPFALSNFVMASMRVNFPAYVLGTLIGMTPRLVVCVMIGQTIGNLEEAKHNPYRFYFFLATVVFAIIILAIFSHLAKKALAKYETGAGEQVSR